MEITVAIVCVLARLLFKDSTLAADLTLYTDEVNPFYLWPRLVYDNSRINLCNGELKLQFKTFLTDALVLYQDDNGMKDFLAITLQDGHLRVVAEFGDEFYKEYRTPETYNDFKWHAVGVRLNCPELCLEVTIDDQVMYETERKNVCRINTGLQIGGFSSKRVLSLLSYWRFHSYFATDVRRGFFNACVRNVRYGETRTNMREITNEYIEHNKVQEGCHLNYCHKPDPICKNKGKCSTAKNGSVICDCRWTGFTGPRCTEGTLELHLDGTYQVKHSFKNKQPRIESYSFRIKTLRKNAVLFYAKGLHNHADFTLIEIKSSRVNLVVNFGGLNARGTNYTAWSSVTVSDGKWHTVHYRKEPSSLSLQIDKITPITKRITKMDHSKMDYDKQSFLGEIALSQYDRKEIIAIQDFIWTTKGNKDDVANFITGLYSTYGSHNAGFSVVPGNKLPRFNKKLPSSTPKTMSNIPSRPSPHCIEGRCTTKGSSQTTTSPRIPENLARRDEDEDDSSITWIIVVTVVFSLLLCVAVVYLVRKWNQRYSGDFQVNRKPIGPAGTIVHYQDAAHKEKQRQMKL